MTIWAVGDKAPTRVPVIVELRPSELFNRAPARCRLLPESDRLLHCREMTLKGHVWTAPAV